MLSIHVPTPDDTRLAPYDHDAANAWLTRLGPTAWVLAQWGYSQCVGTAPGSQLIVDLDDLRIHLGVKTSVLHNALARLSRFNIIHYDVGLRTVFGDFTLPRATPTMTVPVHVVPGSGVAA